MREIFSYELGREKVNNFFSTEFSTLNSELIGHTLRLIPKLLNYQEEGVRIRPTLLFCDSLDKILKFIPNSYAINIFSDEMPDNFHMRIKSLAGLTSNEWIIFVEQKNNKFNYGLIKCINSIKDESFEKLVFSCNNFDKSENIIFFRALSNTAVELKSNKSQNLIIDFTLEDKNTITPPELQLNDFVDDTFKKLRTTKKKLVDIKVLYQNIFEKALKKISGAICVVVDKDYQDSGFFADGVWLKTPIEFSKLFLQSKSFSEAKLLDISNLFIDMLNYDGITIIDNTGRVLAYNVFVESSSSRAANIIGGARKRAAYTITNTKRSKILGVYFQSHDGEVFYKRVKFNNKKAEN